MNAGDALFLPRLRADLEIQAKAEMGSAATEFVVHDPLQHRFFKIDKKTHKVLTHWREGMEMSAFADHLKSQLNLVVSSLQFKQLMEFLYQSNLIDVSSDDDWRVLSQRQANSEPTFFTRALNGHMFFKVPVLKPLRFLDATAPFISIFFSRSFWFCLTLCGLIGLYLASRQWHEFTAGLSDLLTLQGSVYFLFALVFVKIIHELGHAFTAHRYGCKVPQIGIAFMLMMPMLYTDVSDAWRLHAKHKRMLISGAGVITELGLAMLATLLWVFMDDGPLRDVALVVGTTSWLLSLFFNFNPFMKFDGYYLLSDYLELENLQTRAFEQLKWRLRRFLFAPKLPAPEELNHRTRRFMVCYALGTFIYRIGLALGIILMVYHFVFKLLALVLLVVEVWLLLLRPLFNELTHWGKVEQAYISRKRKTAALIGAAGLIVFLFVPMPGRVDVPAVMQAANLAQIYSPQAARITEILIDENTVVNKGDPLLRLEDENLRTELSAAETKLAATKAQLARAIASTKDKSDWLVLREKLSSQQTVINGLKKRSSELVLRAPVSGKVIQFNQTLHQGRWIGRDTLVALVSGSNETVINGYAEDVELDRIATGSVGKFIPNDITRGSVQVKISQISEAAIREIRRPELLSQNGGWLEADTSPGNNGQLIEPRYRIEMIAAKQSEAPNQIVSGIVMLKAERQSVAQKVLRNVGKVLVREVGF